MCLPVLLGAVLSGVGSMITASEQEANAKRQAKARNDKMELTLGRNDQIAQHSKETLDRRLGKITPDAVAKDQKGQTAQRTAQVQAQVADPNASAGAIPLAGDAPDVVKSALATKMLDVFKQGKSRAQALGTLGGYGDQWMDQGFANAGMGRNQSIDNNFMQGNLSILPAQQDVAERNAYKPISPIGGILSGLGGMFSGGGGFSG